MDRKPRRIYFKGPLRATVLQVATQALIKGVVAWSLLNPDGSVAAQGGQDNLILDRGLDTFMTSLNHSNTGVSTTQTSLYGDWRKFLAVGTSSTAPLASQTSLGAEVMRGNTNGGFNAELTATYAVVAGVFTATYTNVRVLDFTASFNLTEFGLSDASSGTVNIRELFRDGGGNPITLSVQSGQQLKLNHVLTISLVYTNIPATTSFTITGIGNIDGKATWCANTGSAANFANMMNQPFSAAGTPYLKIMTAANNLDPNATGGTFNGTDFFAFTPATYVSGSFKRTKTAVVPTSGGNYTQFGWAVDYLGSAGFGGAGWKFALTSPTSITKTSANRLTLDWEITVARAA